MNWLIVQQSDEEKVNGILPEYLRVGARLIDNGEHAGKYLVNYKFINGPEFTLPKEAYGGKSALEQFEFTVIYEDIVVEEYTIQKPVSWQFKDDEGVLHSGPIVQASLPTVKSWFNELEE